MLSALAAVAGVLLVVFGVASPQPSKGGGGAASQPEPTVTAAPTAGDSAPASAPPPSAPPPTTPPASPSVPPGTVLRTESFDLANGYGFKVGSAPLRPKPNDTEHDWHVWNSDVSMTTLQAVGGAHFVLLGQDEDPGFETCQRRSAYVDYLDSNALDGRNVCIYTTKGLVALMHVDSSTRVDQYTYNLAVTVTVWSA